MVVVWLIEKMIENSEKGRGSEGGRERTRERSKDVK